MTLDPLARAPSIDPWLHGLPLVDGLEGASLDRFLAAAGWVDLGAGETVFPEGIATPYLATVVRGRVALRLHVPERGSRTILTLEPGDVLGWSALVPPFRTTSLSVAVEPTELAVLDAPALRAALADDAALAAAIYPAILGCVAARLEASRQQLLDLFRGSAVEPW